MFPTLFLLETAQIWFPENDMARLILELYTAGTENTTTTLRWLLLFLVTHEDVQAKCREEILQVEINR